MGFMAAFGGAAFVDCRAIVARPLKDLLLSGDILSSKMTTVVQAPVIHANVVKQQDMVPAHP